MRKIKKYFRHTIFGLRVILFEKPRGLDFTMPVISARVGDNSGYSKTNERHLKKIFSFVHSLGDYNSIIDIGCGKGVVLKEAAKFPFKKISGIEYSRDISEIAQKNFKQLNMEHINIYNCSAEDFDNYNDYDVFYLFNPFGGKLFKNVIDKIFEDNKKSFIIIYHNPVEKSYLETKKVERIAQFYDYLKDYETYIYRCN